MQLGKQALALLAAIWLLSAVISFFADPWGWWHAFAGMVSQISIVGLVVTGLLMFIPRLQAISSMARAEASGGTVTIKEERILDSWATLLEQCQGEDEGIFRL